MLIVAIGPNPGTCRLWDSGAPQNRPWGPNLKIFLTFIADVLGFCKRPLSVSLVLTKK